ncbi:hypothetical protein HH682_13620 [Rosenbergiella sp. S61]|uniref:Uncharacterized protein n=1 Tax=Rosenbergiella gaditana TaxID=2726987 RepID=A0ABS5SZ98_9GAMM|nr:hypothetical protein [Rosenbergiella gaditana]MBT0725438.1 hypothetical protein [Rosenbergiella gaditana]
MTDYTTMTPQISFDAIHNEAFKHVLVETLKEQELVDQFCRLYKCEKPKRRNHPLEEMVDQITGFRQHQWNEFFKQFIPFVHRVVYMPLLCELESKQPC